jgi:cellulose synthase/poly-beta-1,6-N-acetylglucosamine synthase-like glycosyltransferase
MNIAKGKKLGWSTEAIVYDEQPVGFKQSWKQRMRWSVGHIQCVKYYLTDLVKGVKEHKTLMNFDGLLYLMGMPMLVITLGLLLVNMAIYLSNGMTSMDLIDSYIRYLYATFLMPTVTSIFILILDKRPIRPMIKGLLLYPIFMGSWIIINIKALIKPDTKWEKIEHVKDIKIKELV